MDNFLFNIQSIKSQIDNIKLQLSNIELQYNNMNGINQGEQLLNISIQILNTGIQAFNSGQKHTMSSIENYYNQLKNISDLINSILVKYQNIQMIQQQMYQQQMIQPQMMNMPRPVPENLDGGNFGPKEKMNITFYETTGIKKNFIFDYGTRIKDVLEKFSKRIGIPKFNYTFLFNGNTLNHDDERKIEDELFDCAVITVIRK